MASTEQLTASLADNLAALNAAFRDCADLVCHRINPAIGPAGALLFLEGLVQQELLDHDLLGRVTAQFLQPDANRIAAQSTYLGEVRTVSTVEAATDAILQGSALLLTDGSGLAIMYGVRGGESRSISEPMIEPSIRGPKDAFVENLRVNTSLLRRKIRNTALKVQQLKVGRITHTTVAIVYVEGLADPAVLAEVKRRLTSAELDSVLDGGYLEQAIEDSHLSPFPQVQNTERPDTVAANLLEGRIAILTDGTPFALIVPVVFAQFLQASEDYYERWFPATAIRLLRFMLLLIALLLPSLYVAIITFHQEMAPSPLLYSVVSAREGVPFPALVEALLMEVSFEILREAGIRLPRAIGQAVSIVGALVIGQAAVQAGIVSAPMVIIVSITGISSFAIPRFNMALSMRLLRFPLMLLAGTLGMFGIMAGLSGLLLHLCSLRSFGAPYLSPLAPLQWRGVQDTIIRQPPWSLGRQLRWRSEPGRPRPERG